MVSRILFALCLLTLPLSGENKAPEVDKLSMALGQLLGKNIQSLEFDYDIDVVVNSLKEATSGNTPALSEAECMQIIRAAQQSAHEEKAAANLAKAEEFLKKNAKSAGVQSFEKGKLQYKIAHKGKGPAVKEGSSPVIRYVGKYLDGSVFGKSTEDQTVSLDEMIPGFQQGLIGMKEGEKRTLFIHPDLAYGTKGMLPPNSLLTFEIEIVKAGHEEALADIKTQ